MLCCGAGFSSSALTQKMKREIVENGLEDKVMIEFSPFSLIEEFIDSFDIIICCPHLRVEINNYFKKKTLSIPLYILPPRMYGLMDINEIYKDCIQIIKIFNEKRINPVHFAGEENIMRVSRFKAYYK